jgi:4'-phosphopantetheinyl transferase
MHNRPIDLWTIYLNTPLYPINEYLMLLSENELARLNRFQSDEDKRRYTVAHASLRNILASYLPVKPEAIQFEVNAQGKPALHSNHTKNNIHFNLSHSGELALVAVVRDRPVGVDVEWIKPLNDHLKLAERHFSPAEISTIKNMEADTSSHAFIQLWTGKEALIKARGNGLSLPLDQFSLDTLIDQPYGSACTVSDPENVRSWWISPVHVPEGYLGAVAVEGEPRAVKYLSG